MLLPQLQISQDQCKSLIIRDTTPPYSPGNLGGYGGVNIEADRIIWTVFTFLFSNGLTYEIGNTYNQTKGEWILDAQDLPVDSPNTSTQPCASCGSGHVIIHSDEGRLNSFPTGCITVKYDVYSADIESPTGKKLEGSKVAKFISKCEQTSKMLEWFDKLTYPNQDGRFTDVNNEEERDLKIKKLMLIWTKLELLESAEGCDCNCIAAQIKLADTYLSSLV